MSVIHQFEKILSDSRAVYEKAAGGDRDHGQTGAGKFFVTEETGPGTGRDANILALGDNMDFMAHLLNSGEMAGKIKLIYIDPPFFSKAKYDAVIQLKGTDGKKLPPVRYFAYDDIWQKDMAGYLNMLCSRLYMMKDLMAENGTIWVHLDWHVVHYVKVLMDEIFGEKNFVNEIIWQYKSGGSGKRHYARKHDTILVYSKTKDYYLAPPKEKSYNRGFKPYRFKGVKEYKDETGWYTMVTMKDIWNVDMVGRTSAERTGYATQKPEALLKRISKENHLGTINPIVDIYNSVSLSHAMPCGGEDIDRMEGNLLLTRADGDEPFYVIGSDENQPPFPGELVYKDDRGAVCRCWTWREAKRTMLTEETKNAMLCCELIDLQRWEDFLDVLECLKRETEEKLGGKAQIKILDIDHREAELL